MRELAANEYKTKQNEKITTAGVPLRDTGFYFIGAQREGAGRPAAPAAAVRETAGRNQAADGEADASR